MNADQSERVKFQLDQPSSMTVSFTAVMQHAKIKPHSNAMVAWSVAVMWLLQTHVRYAAGLVLAVDITKTSKSSTTGVS